MSYVPTREEAFQLVKEFNKTDSLIKHALTVEGVMRHFAELLNQPDVEKWGIVGLVHDLDYELYPEQHCVKTGEILRERNWPADYTHAIQSHGYGICIDVEPVETMEKVLYTIDELTGLIAATALMRPNKSILDMEIKSVNKKWKQKSFATGVNRELIEEGAKKIPMDLDKVIEETLNGMKKISEAIGLRGDL
jgi:predicted hydrolase (HD superfamily)